MRHPLVVIALATLAAGQAPPRDLPQKQNLASCINGRLDCDFSTLTATELGQVAAASKKRNLDKCLEGSTGCDPSRLASSEAAQVERAEKRRNFQQCMAGSSKCDPILL